MQGHSQGQGNMGRSLRVSSLVTDGEVSSLNSTVFSQALLQGSPKVEAQCNQILSKIFTGHLLSVSLC